jgi:hypothetical protein
MPAIVNNTAIPAITQCSVDNPTTTNITIVGVITDIFSNLPLYMPLALGTMFFSSDTNQLLFGTPGIGRGYIQIGDTTNVNELLAALLKEVKAMKLAVVALACEGFKNKPDDFDTEKLSEKEL